MDSDQVIGTTEAARILNVHPNTILQWISREVITPCGRKPGGAYLFPMSEVNRLKTSFTGKSKTEAKPA